MENNNKFTRAVGQVLGVALVGCAAGCLCALAIGLSIKFLMFLF